MPGEQTSGKDDNATGQLGNKTTSAQVIFLAKMEQKVYFAIEMKCIASVFLALLLAQVERAEAQFDYTTNEDGMSITLTGYYGPAGDVTIPAEIDGYAVTSIGDSAFISTLAFTNVTI